MAEQKTVSYTVVALFFIALGFIVGFYVEKMIVDKKVELRVEEAVTPVQAQLDTANNNLSQKDKMLTELRDKMRDLQEQVDTANARAKRTIEQIQADCQKSLERLRAQMALKPSANLPNVPRTPPPAATRPPDSGEINEVEIYVDEQGVSHLRTITAEDKATQAGQKPSPQPPKAP